MTALNVILGYVVVPVVSSLVNTVTNITFNNRNKKAGVKHKNPIGFDYPDETIIELLDVDGTVIREL